MRCGSGVLAHLLNAVANVVIVFAKAKIRTHNNKIQVSRVEEHT